MWERGQTFHWTDDFCIIFCWGSFLDSSDTREALQLFSKSDIRDKGDIFIISATAASDELFYSFKYFYVGIAYVKRYSNIDSVIDFS